ncbi:unnamed protein product [Paramecium pentaurelia]|uniref:Uncharacterized protein n=1 Tax=Paramecium pentaurelia TaxID=43138 RepID=A0A8S1SR69_9CILI|nr:unnamed protein product [Paramecium pentaurelia]
MQNQTEIYLGCNQIVYESIDKDIRTYEVRQPKETQPFVYFDWDRKSGQKTLVKGKWYCFKNYKIENKMVVPIKSLNYYYKKITPLKKEELKIDALREPYSNLLGVIQDVSDLDKSSRDFPFRTIKILLKDGIQVVEVLLKNKFATQREEKFEIGEIIYIYQCKKNLDSQKNLLFYSSLTNNTKIKFDLQQIRKHINRTTFQEIIKLRDRQNLQVEVTEQIE